jgi:hypothetical protein
MAISYEVINTGKEVPTATPFVVFFLLVFAICFNSSLFVALSAFGP